ncbi:putative dsRNA-binding protein [Deinococcus cellulosilyticus]|uniref:DRBM domain-containing protein n=1 Tax=Deinococcus cellulosilyticus (strain DSM 18568 / NBRC 106333 / KACC 11606 / 5516J-15) TaxID=1223518 RepID=A0A511MZK8_DEIC1|nr:putative dsRNA-binding protein [Deinococcus cellulosilyticus]GEM45751.1 hypothetical protein DC3_13860 [Deinococcus cellulosilyticus NBRC 106333 = KACC 11606]
MQNPKGDLIDYCRAQKLRNPKFETRGTGPEHEPLFITDVIINDEVRATGQGSSKRESERTASLLALESLTAQFGPIKTKDPQRKTTDRPLRLGYAGGTMEGPYPIYADVLSQALVVANSRVDSSRRGPESIDMVRRLTLDLYKGLLEELGAVAEVPQVEVKEA